MARPITRHRWCVLIFCLGVCRSEVISVSQAQTSTRGSASAAPTEAVDIRSLLQVQTVVEGSSSRQVRGEALESLPLARMHQRNRQLAEEILGNISIFRRLPTVRCEMTPEVYSYFRSHPDVAIGIWHVMGISEMQLTRQNPYTFHMSTGDGTQGTVQILHQTSNNMVLLCNGQFLNPLTNRPISAQALFHLVTRFHRDNSGRVWLTHHADMFVTFPSQTVDAIARMISPVSNRICDQNFEEITMFVRMMDLAIERQPESVQRMASLVQGVSEESKLKLVELAAAETVSVGRPPVSPATPGTAVFGENLFSPFSPTSTGAQGSSAIVR